jgi:hypothetical protein
MSWGQFARDKDQAAKYYREAAAKAAARGNNKQAVSYRRAADLATRTARDTRARGDSKNK